MEIIYFKYEIRKERFDFLRTENGDGKHEFMQV